MSLSVVFQKLIQPGNEGGYANLRGDPGGQTKFGITEKLARAHGFAGPMTLLSEATAERIYDEEYWSPYLLEHIPEYLQYPFFAFLINTTPTKAVKALQIAVGAHVDGQMGPETLRFAQIADPKDTLRRFSWAKVDALTQSADWPLFSRGWMSREARFQLSQEASCGTSSAS